MNVRAIKKGYYGLMLREPGTQGEVFDLKDEADFSHKWMERVPTQGKVAWPGSEKEPKAKEPKAKHDKSVI